MTFVRCVTANEVGDLVDEDAFIWRKKKCSIANSSSVSDLRVHDDGKRCVSTFVRIRRQYFFYIRMILL
jgi:hypothetical protein